MNSTSSDASPSDEVIRRAVQHIESGRVVAIPTETYYGLAADPENEEALARLFSIKQRPEHKPILILISAIDQLYRYTATIPVEYNRLIDRYWPGPLTLVFPARDHVPILLTGGTGTVGIRLTSDNTARRIIDMLGKPITATSANLSNHEPARNINQVMEAFGENIADAVDGGQSSEGPGSTVIRVVNGSLCLARAGRVIIPDLPDC